MPSDEFGGQEFPTAAEIKGFVQQYGFPNEQLTMLTKGSTNGANADGLFKFAKAAFPGDTQWNFSDKYIFDSAGSCVARSVVHSSRPPASLTHLTRGAVLGLREQRIPTRLLRSA